LSSLVRMSHPTEAASRAWLATSAATAPAGPTGPNSRLGGTLFRGPPLAARSTRLARRGVHPVAQEHGRAAPRSAGVCGACPSRTPGSSISATSSSRQRCEWSAVRSYTGGGSGRSNSDSGLDQRLNQTPSASAPHGPRWDSCSGRRASGVGTTHQAGNSNPTENLITALPIGANDAALGAGGDWMSEHRGAVVHGTHQANHCRDRRLSRPPFDWLTLRDQAL
jgi:hypothetical protein